MSTKKNLLSTLCLAGLMALTFFLTLRGQNWAQMMSVLRQARWEYLAGGLGLMLVYISCEGLCTRQVLSHLGYTVSFARCLSYSCVGFYVSSVTPSATGGQPAQIWCMSRDGVSPAHGALNMMLIAACYQTSMLLYALGVWLFLPGLRVHIDGGLGLMLLYGGIVMVLLTVGMGAMMFLPGVARRAALWVLGGLRRVKLVKNPAAEEKVDGHLRQYAQGAACIRRSPGLMLRLILLCMVQLTALFAVPYLVYLSFGLSGSSPWELVGMQALLTLAVCNIPLPGGVGAAEGGFLAAFLPFFGPALVAPAMVAARGLSFYLFLIFCGGIVVAVCLRQRREKREKTLSALRRENQGRVRAVQRCLEIRADLR